MQKKKGISLIVLVITIIVMIILAAAVIISMNNTGVIDKASHAVKLTDEKQVQDLAALTWAEAYLDEARTESIDKVVKEELAKHGITESEWNIVITETGVTVTKKQNTSGDLPVNPSAPNVTYDVGTFVFSANGTATLYKEDNTKIEYSGWKTAEYSYNEVPWYSEMANITNVIFEEGAIPAHTSYWFYQAPNLLSVILPEGITKVSGHTFETCKKLQKVVIPNSVTEIGDYALAYCNFTSIGIIGSGCDVEISSNVNTFGESVFLRCEKLNKVTMPEGWEKITVEMFYGCNGLTSIGGASSAADLKIASTVKTIDYGAFYYAEGLKNVEIPSNVTTIVGSAFENAENIENLTFNTGITSIGNYAFSGCYLKSITYKGTTTNWNKVTKGEYWYDYNSPLVEADGVVCTG